MGGGEQLAQLCDDENMYEKIEFFKTNQNAIEYFQSYLKPNQLIKMYDNENGRKKIEFFGSKNKMSSIDYLLKLGLQPDELSHLYDNKLEAAQLMINNHLDIEKLIENGFNLKDIIKICNDKFELAKIIIENRQIITEYVEKELTPENLIKCNPDQVKRLLDGKIKPTDLKKELFVQQPSINKEIRGPNSERIIRSRSNSPVSSIGNAKK